MSVKKILCIITAAMMMVSASSCSESKINVDKDISSADNISKSENSTQIERFFDVNDYDEMLRYTLPIAADEQRIFFADDYYTLNETDNIAVELSMYEVDITGKKISYDGQAGELPTGAEQVIRQGDFLFYVVRENENVQVFRYDTGTQKTASVRTDIYPGYLRTDDEGNVYMHAGPKGKVLYVYDRNLELKERVDIADELAALGMENRFVYDMCVSPEGDVYFTVSEKYIANSILKLEDSGKLNNITGDITDLDESMNVNRCFMDKEGNLVLCSGRAECMVDVISSVTGEIINRYEFFLAGELIGPSEQYDMIYTSEGEIFGYDYMEDASECIVSQEAAPGLDEIYEYGNISGEKVYVTLSSPKYQKIYETDRTTGKTEAYEAAVSDILFADISEDGTLYYAASEHGIANDDVYGTYETTRTEIYRLDEQGESQLVASLPQYRTEIYLSDFSLDRNGNMLFIYPSSEEDALEGILSLIVMDTDGNIIKTVPLSDEELCSIAEDNEQMSYICECYSGNMIKINQETYELSDEKFVLPQNDFISDGRGEYSFFYRDDYAVYGYNTEDGSSEEIMTFNDYEWPYESDSGELFRSSIIVLSPSEIVSCGGHLLTRCSEERIAQLNSKKIITVAVSGSSDILKQNVAEFNFENDEYRIFVKDYSKFVNDDEYQVFGKDSENLAADILKGDIPDIILADDMEISSSIAAGLFTDHKKLMENDSRIKEGYSERLIEEFTYNGKMYTIPVRYNSVSLFGTGSHENWSYDELMKCGESGEAVYDYLSSPFYLVFRTLFLSYAHDHMDMENGTCDFDNEKFVKLLEFIKENSYMEDTDEYIGYENEEFQFVLETVSNYDDFFRIVSYEKDGGIKTPYSCGIPSEKGGKRYIIPELCFSVTEKSDSKEAAWEFIRMFFNEDHQNYSLPALGEFSEYQISDMIMYFPEYDNKDVIEAYKAYLDMPVISGIMYSRAEEIAYECANEFMNGSISAEEAAKKIQSKITMYLGELL